MARFGVRFSSGTRPPQSYILLQVDLGEGVREAGVSGVVFHFPARGVSVNIAPRQLNRWLAPRHSGPGVLHEIGDPPAAQPFLSEIGSRLLDGG